MYVLSAPKSAAMVVRALKCKAEIGARAADQFRQFERYIELVRCQNDVLTIIEVAENLQACGSVVLVLRTAGKHEKSHAETQILCINKIPKCPIGFFKEDGAIANLLNKNVVDYPGTTANNAFVVTTSACKPAACSASHHNGSCEADEKEKLNHHQIREFHDNLRPVQIIATSVTVNCSQINFLITVVLTRAKANLKRPL